MSVQVAVSSCGLPDHNKFSYIEFIRIATMSKVIHHHAITYSVLYSFVKVHTLRVDCPPLCKLLEESQPRYYFDRSFDLGSTPYRLGFITSNLGCHYHPSYPLPENKPTLRTQHQRAPYPHSNGVPMLDWHMWIAISFMVNGMEFSRYNSLPRRWCGCYPVTRHPSGCFGCLNAVFYFILP